jgi:hypothetical protein
MNIFFLDRDITKCAQAHCDKHVNKMILEGAQLLASAIHVLDPKLAQAQPDLYRLTHKNHPCAVWVRADAHNYMYLLDLMEALNTEAQWRYARQTDHLSLVKAREWYPPQMPFVRFTEPPKCVHDDFKYIQDPVEAYREYYRRDKKEIAYWTKRERPEWFRT